MPEEQTKFLLPKLHSLHPSDNSLEILLILMFKAAYNITEADAERIHEFAMSMFYEGCVVGSETVMAALQTQLELRKAASTPSSNLVN
jgi:hypothetical protein